MTEVFAVNDFDDSLVRLFTTRELAEAFIDAYNQKYKFGIQLRKNNIEIVQLDRPFNPNED